MPVYLICLEKPLAAGHPARHYMGYAHNPEALRKRLACHAAGNGSRFMEVVGERGIRWQVTRLWMTGDRDLERRLKNRHESPRLCPVCAGRAPHGYSVDIRRECQIATATPMIATRRQARKRQPMRYAPVLRN